ncbi:Vacuolar membrane-associated protein [Trichinella pseudospiralis]
MYWSGEDRRTVRVRARAATDVETYHMCGTQSYGGRTGADPEESNQPTPPGGAYKLRYIGKRVKSWGCSKDKKGCGGALWTNVDVTSMIKQNDYIGSCLRSQECNV